MWERGGKEKQASKLAEQLQQKHMAMPLRTSLDPPPDPGEMAALARFLTLPKFHLASFNNYSRFL